MHLDTFDESLRPIFLFSATNNSNHIIFIQNLKAFFNASKTKSCFFCKNTFKKTNVDHQCEIRQTCRACKRHFNKECKKPCKMLFNNFCNKSNTTDEIVLSCKTCNMKLVNENCELYHSKHCGKVGCLGYQCTKCKTFINRTKGCSNAVKISEVHKCCEQFCKICKTYYSENDHLCSLKKIEFKNDSFTLAFLTMEFLHESKDSLVTNEIPYVIVIFKELQPSSGLFQSYTISDFEKDVIVGFDEFNYNYSDFATPNITQLKMSENFYHKCKEAKQMDQTVLEKFISLLVKWNSVTILCADENGFIFQAFIKAFIKANINVKILSKGKKFFSCEVPELKIRLLNSTNYLPGDEYEVAKVSNVFFNDLFFPLKLNQQSFYNYVGKIPDLTYFTCQSDTEEIYKKKEHFVMTFSQEWVLQEQILKFSEQKCKLLCSSVCLF